MLQAIFRRHYAAFAESYPSRYACHYGRFRLAQYMARPPISLSKVTLEEQGPNVLFHTRYNPYFRQSLKLFAVTDFIAELTQHLPPKGVHYIPAAVLR
jgi:hypothetical protein